MQVGILALQGAVGLHEKALQRLGIDSISVRRPDDLFGISGIILPGGESTTLLHLLNRNELWEPLKEFAESRPVWGVCAGAILLARKVLSPSQNSLAVLDIEMERNGYGRQLDSFVSELESVEWKEQEKFEGVFIRAPRIKSMGEQVRVLMSLRGEPVLVEEEHLLVSTFHPELTNSPSIHQYFIKKMVH